jgi:hypothetical protein
MPRFPRAETVAVLLGPFIVLVGVSTAHAGDDFFLLMFGSQRTPSDPNYAHSFATFVRASWPGDGPCPAGAVLEATTISWLPRNGVVRTCALHPE